MKRSGHFPYPIRIPIEDSIDLHSFSPKEIPYLLEEYLGECIKAGIYEVRIIHGKGTGQQAGRSTPTRRLGGANFCLCRLEVVMP